MATVGGALPAMTVVDSTSPLRPASQPVTASSVVRRDLERLEEVTGQIVGRMFFGKMLKSMRESSLNRTIGHGGRGEEVFSAQLHGIIAERMGTATQGGLKKSVFDTMSRQQELISGRVGTAHHLPGTADSAHYFLQATSEVK